MNSQQYGTLVLDPYFGGGRSDVESTRKTYEYEELLKASDDIRKALAPEGLVWLHLPANLNREATGTKLLKAYRIPAAGEFVWSHDMKLGGFPRSTHSNVLVARRQGVNLPKGWDRNVYSVQHWENWDAFLDFVEVHSPPPYCVVFGRSDQVRMGWGLWDPLAPPLVAPAIDDIDSAWTVVREKLEKSPGYRRALGFLVNDILRSQGRDPNSGDHHARFQAKRAVDYHADQGWVRIDGDMVELVRVPATV